MTETLTDRLDALREVTTRWAQELGIDSRPRLFPLSMTEDAVRARVKSFGMYGEGRTAREWYAVACPWIGGAK